MVQRVAEEVITQGDIDSAARYVWRKPDYSSVQTNSPTQHGFTVLESMLIDSASQFQ
jgi:hypothetical protein